MGLVSRDVLDLLEPYGRAAFGARIRGQAVTDPRFDWPNFFARVHAAYHTDAAQTIAEIRAASAGNPFATYGGYQVLVEVGPATSDDPRFLELMDHALDMLHETKQASGILSRNEADRWIETHGDLRVTFDHIVEVEPPESGHAAGLDLAPGQSLLVAATGPDPLDNQFFVECLDGARYGVYSMRKRSSDSTTLTRCEEGLIPTASSPEDILRAIGGYFRLPPYWSHEALRPYFTEHRAV